MEAQNKSTVEEQKKSRKSITLFMKVQMIRMFEQGASPANIGEVLGFARTTVKTVLNSKEKILEQVRHSTSFNTIMRKRSRANRKREGVVGDMERLLLKWIKEQNALNVPLSISIIQNRALSIYNELKAQQGGPSKDAEFVASRGWYDRFKKRANLQNFKVQEDAEKAESSAIDFTAKNIEDGDHFLYKYGLRQADDLERPAGIQDPEPPKLKAMPGVAGSSSSVSGAPSPVGRTGPGPSIPIIRKVAPSGPQAAPSSKQNAPSATIAAPSAASLSGGAALADPPSPADQSDGEVCLRWNSHHSNMQTTFPSLLDSEQYVDVTLAADGRVIKCHRLILSSCSTYFDEILKGIVFPQHPVIFLKDIPFWIIKALVDFMYRGEVNIDQSKLPDLLHAAEILQVKGLAGKHNTTEEPKLPKDVSRAASTPKVYSHDRSYAAASSADVEDYPAASSTLELPSTSKITSPTRRPSSPKRYTKKRKTAVLEMPEEMPMLRRGTKSRPNVKQPKYYEQEYDVPSPTDDSNGSETHPSLSAIKVEPIDVYESDMSFNVPVEADRDPFVDMHHAGGGGINEDLEHIDAEIRLKIKHDDTMDIDPGEHSDLDDCDDDTNIDLQLPPQTTTNDQSENNGTSSITNTADKGGLQRAPPE